MYLDTHVIASLALIASLVGISVGGIALLRQAMKRDAARAR
ncbi:hypothetical protein [Halomonas stenophila]|uniref:Uncharacterized protein n=1 Tax=Halomonas stenophila TaxID=795312 RepID=A0A7W5N374_9GAMM|nr:hypothetical protein [Halomonas stenophila]MBB3232999.1 hypothetical protein [Halomonas stenophila]